MATREGKAANPFHSLAALQKLAHHASFRTAAAVAFPHDHDLHSAALGRQPARDWIFFTLFESHGASQSPERREGADTKETMKQKNVEATESLYRDPSGLRPDRKELTIHRKRALVGDRKRRLQA